MEIKCKMISCSNLESRGLSELNNDGKLSLSTCFYFNSIRSSKIKSIEFTDGGHIIIETKNTTYVFKQI